MKHTSAQVHSAGNGAAPGEHRAAELGAVFPLHPPADDARVAGFLAEFRARDQAKTIRAAECELSADTFDDEYIDALDLANLPQPVPLIGGVLNRHSNAVLRGRDGTWKSFTALDWGLSLATARPWQDHPTERVRVLYVAGEGAFGLDKRVAAWRSAWRRTPDPGGFTLRKSAVNLFRGGPAFEDLLRRVTQGRYGLVILDTLRRMSGGADGNGTDMGVVVDNVERIKRATADGSTLTLAHTDKGDNDTRGWSGCEDDMDIVWHAKRDDVGALELTNTKMKDGPDGAVIMLTPTRWGDSLILQNQNSGGPRATTDAASTDAKVMAEMHDTFTTTGATVAQLVATLGLDESTIYRSRGRLEKAGKVVLVKRGNGHVVCLPPRD